MHLQLPTGGLPDNELPAALANLRRAKLGAALHQRSRDELSTVLLLGARYDLLRTDSSARMSAAGLSTGARDSIDTRTADHRAAAYRKRPACADRSGR